jgi:hypothetical protein
MRVKRISKTISGKAFPAKNQRSATSPKTKRKRSRKTSIKRAKRINQTSIAMMIDIV